MTYEDFIEMTRQTVHVELGNDKMAYQAAQRVKKSGEMGEMLSGKMYLCTADGVILRTVVKVYEV